MMSENWPFNTAKMAGTSSSIRRSSSCLRAATKSSRGHASSSDAVFSSTRPSIVVSSRRINYRTHHRRPHLITLNHTTDHATPTPTWRYVNSELLCITGASLAVCTWWRHPWLTEDSLLGLVDETVCHLRQTLSQGCRYFWF